MSDPHGHESKWIAAPFALALLIVPVIAAFPDSPEWSWGFAKLCMIFSNFFCVAIYYHYLTSKRYYPAAFSGACCFISGICLLIILTHFLIKHAHFPRGLWQVMDVYSAFSFFWLLITVIFDEPVKK